MQRAVSIATKNGRQRSKRRRSIPHRKQKQRCRKKCIYRRSINFTSSLFSAAFSWGRFSDWMSLAILPGGILDGIWHISHPAPDWWPEPSVVGASRFAPCGSRPESAATRAGHTSRQQRQRSAAPGLGRAVPGQLLGQTKGGNHAPRIRHALARDVIGRAVVG